MFQPYQLSLALRYLRERGGNGFISFISLVSMLGIAIGVAVLIVVLAVMNGFDRELRARILGMTAHATLTGFSGPLDDWRGLKESALAHEGVLAAAPFVEGQGVLVAGDRTSGTSIRGVAPAMEAEVTRIGDYLNEGSLSDLVPGEFNIVLGYELAAQLAVEVGDTVVLVVPQGMVTPAGLMPRLRSFRVSGLFEAGMYEYDRALALINLEDATKLYRTGGRATGLRLLVEDAFAAGTLARELAVDAGGGFYVGDWTRQHANFFRSIQLTKSILFVILLLVIGVAAFNIVSTLAMVVREKRSDIAILKTLGSGPADVVLAFAGHGTLIGVVGTLMGVALGVVLSIQLGSLVVWIESLSGVDLLAADVYFLSDLPTALAPSEIAQIALLALVLAIAATVVPAMTAGRVEPARALRHD